MSYLGALYQALLDLSDWVERAIEPNATSGYTIDGGQVIIPEDAKDRKGIQPGIRLEAAKVSGNGQEEVKSNKNGRISVKAGERVSFTAYIELPERAGDVEKAIWDFEADNEFLPNGTIGITQWGEDGIGRAIAVAEHIFTRPGIYFPVVKVASNRTFGDQFTCVWNQARIRVVVKE